VTPSRFNVLAQRENGSLTDLLVARSAQAIAARVQRARRVSCEKQSRNLLPIFLDLLAAVLDLSVSDNVPAHLVTLSMLSRKVGRQVRKTLVGVTLLLGIADMKLVYILGVFADCFFHRIQQLRWFQREELVHMFLRQKHAQVVELDVKCLDALMTICRGHHRHSPFCRVVTRDAATHPKAGSAFRRMAIVATSHDVHSSRSSTDVQELGEKRQE
jgi:hypothetical protein